MNTVNYHVLNDSVVLNYDGKTQVVSRDDGRYAKVIAAIKENRLDDIPGLVEIERSFFGTGIELRDGLLCQDDKPLPEELSNRILKFRDEGLPFEALFKFWDLLKGNPSFNARKMLFSFLEHNGHPLTQDGCFIAYRGVREDFKDKHTGTFDNSVGSVLSMPRDQVDDNPNNTCSTGLHVACYDYAKGFGEKLVEVKVNPADVVCVPTDYNGTKMRVCKFEVVKEAEMMRTESLYGHESEIEADDSDDDCDESDDKCSACGADRDAFANYCGECGHEF